MHKLENLLISALPRVARSRFLAHSEIIELQANCVLWQPDEVSGVAFFPMAGYLSLEAVSQGQPVLELDMIGQEGMAGMHLLLGAKSSSLRACVRMQGSAHACNVPALHRLMWDCAPFRESMGRYIDFTLSQLSAAAVCVRFHRIEQRLAKWLLMAQDRVGTGVLHVTHETLAHLLGVRRVGITVAATEMQSAGYIRYKRGEIELLKRKGLEAAACSCYANARLQYLNLTGK